jgi:hypothetical protein
MSLKELIHMGHGQMVDVINRKPDQWELVFSENGVDDYKAPPLEEIGVDIIDNDGQVHTLKVSAGGRRSSVFANGAVANPYRVRVRVLHGTHFHTRESVLPGAAPRAPQLGQHGGALAKIGDGSVVEVKTIDAGRWELIYLKDGKAAPLPAATEVVVQAIGPKAEDYQIRNLTTEAAGEGKLIASGKIRDATHARITVKNGAAEQISSIPIVTAAS